MLTELAVFFARLFGGGAETGGAMLQTVREQGYPIEPHWVNTSDGYILGLFRIPPTASKKRLCRLSFSSTDRHRHPIRECRFENVPRATPPKATQRVPKVVSPNVVFLNHGFLDSSFTFVVGNWSIPYFLSSHGLDVWLGNNRGNPYSLNHTTLPTNSEQFWNFTWEEMALYDLPAQLSYVLDQTGADSLTYIGHSQGTIVAFAGLSLPENLALANLVSLFVGLAPSIGFSAHARGLVKFSADVNGIGLYQWLGGCGWYAGRSPAYPRLLPYWNWQFAQQVLGPTEQAYSADVLTAHLSEFPASSSCAGIFWWAHSSEARRRAEKTPSTQDDGVWHGRYGTYNLSDFRVPSILYYGASDYLVAEEDVENIARALPNMRKQPIRVDGYAHMDYVWAMDARRKIYSPLLNLLDAEIPYSNV